ncbi:membrane bound O-acyl transferase family-domain-containing protein [Collybia nuda]|uniref:Membrane bound O-acyl transferase family-domain-containing protein n=1 Tax=Collybia nuda TaxID=64659 RepID=A0A9P6CF09_9AGAR|nr:membrane bound O-acyl transferase family-domain-containing protein [Collybia nuda]
MSFTAHILVLILFTTGLVIKHSRLRLAIWPVIAGLIYYIFYQNPTNDTGGNASIRVSFIVYLFMASDYILLTNIQREFRLSGQQESIENASFGARLRWALTLFFNPRGVGWSHEPKGILPLGSHLSRGRFILSQLIWSAIYLVLIDIVHFINVHTSVFKPESIPTASLTWHLRVLGVILSGLRATSYLSFLHALLSIICVATSISEPKGWPHLFGKWGDAYTVRKFWGRTWHQDLRRIFSSHGKYLARCLQLPSGSNSSSYVQLYTAFLISGIIHTNPSDARPLYFFIYQALAITFEDAIIALVAKMGFSSPTKAQKILGYIWVLCWFTYSIPEWTDSLITCGLLETFDVGIISSILSRIGPVSF